MNNIAEDKRNAIKERLEQIAKANGGKLRAADVVADAKKADSPLHDHFEWDTKKAAYAYWIRQARVLITSVTIRVHTETTTVESVYYVRDPESKSSEQGYVSVTELRSDEDRARESLVAEFTRIADLLRRVRGLAAALAVENEVETLLRSVVGLRNRLSDDGESATQ
jgi:hypothetical protein